MKPCNKEAEFLDADKLPYDVAEIRRMIAPIAVQYKLKAVYLFGSYARGEATADSDIDLLIDTEGSGLDTLFKLGGLYAALAAAFTCPIDMMTVASLNQPVRHASQEALREQIWNERVGLYAVA